MRNKYFFYEHIKNVCHKIISPFERHRTFTFFMIALAFLSCYIATDVYRDAHLHSKVLAGFVLDIYVLCLFIDLFNKKFQYPIEICISAVAYMLVIIETFCITKFSSTFNPSILQLLFETDARESQEFISTYLSLSSITKPIIIVATLAIVNIIIYLSSKHISRFYNSKLNKIVSICIFAILTASTLRGGCYWTKNKHDQISTLLCNTVGEVESLILNAVPSHDYNDIFGQPISRLAYSLKTCQLLSKQTYQLYNAGVNTTVAQTDNYCPLIILVIGESYNKHHSQLYGYKNATTPNQMRWMAEGNLVPFFDVVSSWDLTSHSFKNMMTTYCIGDSGEWCDYPLLGCVMKKAGYYVSFVTNQFVPNKDNSICGISGGFFLNEKALSDQQFDYRNTKMFEYDAEMLLEDFQRRKTSQHKEFIIYHFLGQHFAYSMRYPSKMGIFSHADINRPDLPIEDKKLIAEYDNSIYYNDYALNLIVENYKMKDAVIIYLSDHSERMFGPGNGKKYGRQTFENIDKDNAIENFEVPMWIYCTDKFKENHEKDYNSIVKNARLPYMTDALPHLIIHLAGIQTSSYNPKRDILSPQYESKRKRMLRKEVNYDQLLAN